MKDRLVEIPLECYIDLVNNTYKLNYLKSKNLYETGEELEFPYLYVEQIDKEQYIKQYDDAKRDRVCKEILYKEYSKPYLSMERLIKKEVDKNET